MFCERKNSKCSPKFTIDKEEKWKLFCEQRSRCSQLLDTLDRYRNKKHHRNQAIIFKKTPTSFTFFLLFILAYDTILYTIKFGEVLELENNHSIFENIIFRVEQYVFNDESCMSNRKLQILWQYERLETHSKKCQTFKNGC